MGHSSRHRSRMGAPKKSGTKETKLYCNGRILGYKRSKVNQYETCSLIKIENVNQKSDVEFYQAKKEINGSKFRVIWGKVCRPHGNNGVARCRFRKNLPPSAIAGPCRVMLYPSRI